MTFPSYAENDFLLLSKIVINLYNLCNIEQYTNHEKRNLFHKNNPSRSCLLFKEMQRFKFYFLNILFFVTFLRMLARITVLCLKILKLKTKAIVFEILFSYFALHYFSISNIHIVAYKKSYSTNNFKNNFNE